MNLCRIMNQGEKAFYFAIKADAVSIGRSNENDIQIDDKYASRNHLMIRKRGNRFFLKNLGNSNNTIVDSNQVPFGAIVEVKKGDTIVIGMSVFCVSEGSLGDMFTFLRSLNFCIESPSRANTVLLEDTIYDFLQ